MSFMVLEKVEKVFATLEEAKEYAEKNSSFGVELVVAKKLGTVKIKTVFEADEHIQEMENKKYTSKRVRKEAAPVKEELEAIELFTDNFPIASNAPETLIETGNFGFIEETKAEKLHKDTGAIFANVLVKAKEYPEVLKSIISDDEIDQRISQALDNTGLKTQEQILDIEKELESLDLSSTENKVRYNELSVNVTDESLVLAAATGLKVEKIMEQVQEVIEATPIVEPIQEKAPEVEKEIKSFWCDLGATSFPMTETNLKKQCNTKFTEALNSDDPIESLKNEKETLCRWYKKDNLDSIDWFNNLYASYIPKASKKALEKATVKEVKSISYEDLFTKFETEINNSKIEQNVFDVCNKSEFTELLSVDKERFDLIKSNKIHECIVRDILESLDKVSDPEQFLRGFSKKTLSDKRVKEAVEARKKLDIAKLEAVKEVAPLPKELTEVEQAIKEVQEATKETLASVTSKYKQFYLSEKNYYEAVLEKEKELNTEIFEELLKEIADKTDIEVVRISSQLKYTYLEKILSDRWNKEIAPKIQNALVKELVEKLPSIPLTNLDKELAKYPSDIRDSQEVKEAINKMKTCF